MNDLIEAIENVRIHVQSKGRFHAPRTPAALLRLLFNRLSEGVQKGLEAGTPLDRPTALNLLRREMGDDAPEDLASAYTTAVAAIADAMNAVHDHSLPPRVLPDASTACVRYRVADTDCWVVVTGPRVDGNSYLQLSVKTVPVMDERAPGSAPVAAVHVDNRVATELLPSPLLHVLPQAEHLLSLPPKVEERLHRIAQQVISALRAVDGDERHRALIRQHLFTVTAGLEDAALQLCLGKMFTEYDDCALLSGRVEAMTMGDELLGLTEWQTDWHWWETDDGRRFREANMTAIAQGAVIRRIFLYATPEGRAAQVKRRREMTSHRNMGVEVKTISIQKVRQFRPSAVDVRSMCVLRSRADGEGWGWLTYSVETSADGRPYRNRFSIHSQDVKENRLLLEEIWHHAHE